MNNSNGNEFDEKINVYETLRRMIFIYINDVTCNSEKLISNANIKSLNDVRNFNTSLIKLSDPIQKKLDDCREFLRTNLYQHPRVNEMTNNAHKIIFDLFNFYVDNFKALPRDYKIKGKKYRSIADFLSGMTDRFANEVYKSLN